jgi:hypothetical protein
MFQRDAYGGAKCGACGQVIKKGSAHFLRMQTGPTGASEWADLHVECAVRVAHEDVLNALRRTTTIFEGRAQIEAAAHEAAARARFKPRSFEGEVAREGQATAAQIAEQSLAATRPVDTVGLLVHEQWAAGRLLEKVREVLAGLYLRSANRGYGFVSFGDDLPDRPVKELQQTVRAFVLQVSTSGSSIAPMNRVLRGVRTSGIPIAALWLVGDAPWPSPARDRREREARELLDAIGLDADSPPVVHSTRVDRPAFERLGEALDEVFSGGVSAVEPPAETAVKSFHWFANEGRWPEALRSLDIALERSERGEFRPSLVDAAVRALGADEVSMTALSILARAKDPKTADALFAFLQAIYEPKAPPGSIVVLVCDLLRELGDPRFEPIAWEAYAHSVGVLREDLEAMLLEHAGENLAAVVEARLQTLPARDPQRATLRKLVQRVQKRANRR